MTNTAVVSALFPPAGTFLHPVCNGNPVEQLQHSSLVGLYTFDDWITDPSTHTIRNRANPSTLLVNSLLPNLTIINPIITNFCGLQIGLCCAGTPQGPFGFGTVSDGITGNAALALSGGTVTMAVWFTPNKNQTMHVIISQLIAGMARWTSVSDIASQSPNVGNGIFENTEIDIALLSTLPGAGATINRMQFEAQILEKIRGGLPIHPFNDYPQFVYRVYLNNTVSELHSGVVAIQTDDLPQPYETWWDNLSINDDYASYYSPTSVFVQYTFRGPSAAGLSRLFLGSCAQNIPTFPYNLCWQGTINMLAIYSTSRISDPILNNVLNAVSMPNSPAFAQPSTILALQNSVLGSTSFALTVFDYDVSEYNCNQNLTVRLLTLPNKGTLYYDSTGHGNWVSISNTPVILAMQTQLSFVPITGINQFGANYASFIFTASDNQPVVPSSPVQATVVINVVPVDLPPVATNASYSIPPQQALSITLTGTDPDNIPSRRNLPGVSANLSAVVILTLPADGTLAYNSHLIIPTDLPYTITFAHGVQAATLTYVANAPLMSQSGLAITAVDAIKFNVLDGLGLPSVYPGVITIDVLNPLQPSAETAATQQVRTQYDREFRVPIFNGSIHIETVFLISGWASVQLSVTNSLPPATDALGIKILSNTTNGILFFGSVPIIDNIRVLGTPPPLIPYGSPFGSGGSPDLVFYQSAPITTTIKLASIPILTSPVLQYLPFNTTAGYNVDYFEYQIIDLVTTFASAVFRRYFYVNDPPIWFGPTQYAVPPALTAYTNTPTNISMILINGNQTAPITVTVAVGQGDGTITLGHPELYKQASYYINGPVGYPSVTFTSTLAVAAALVTNITFVPTFYGVEVVTFTAADTNVANGLAYSSVWTINYNVILQINPFAGGSSILPLWATQLLYAIGAFAGLCLVFLLVWFFILACGLQRHFTRLASSGGGNSATAGASKGAQYHRMRISARKGSRPLPTMTTKIQQPKAWQTSMRSSSTQGAKGKYSTLGTSSSRSASDKGYSSSMSIDHTV